MKKNLLISLIFLILILLQPSSAVTALAETERPVLAIISYTASSVPARGEDFNMVILIKNSGQRAARNIFIEFVSGELIPRNNGGLQTMAQLIENETKGVSQPFTVSADLWGASIANVSVNIEYSDYDGNVYSDSFTLAVDLNVPSYSAPQPTPTPTSSPILNPQLVIASYSTDVEVLQPGTRFELMMDVTNLGNASAKAVTLVLGGGSVEANPEGTPQPGISGGQGEFTNFAPLESANVKYIGDIPAGQTLSVSQKIIVNVTTAPGAYSLKYSFIYLTDDGRKVVDNQVITLLVYRMPAIEVGFYQDPGPIFAGQPNNLPLQIMNLGRTPVVLGSMVVTADGAAFENHTALVGPVDAGFYFTLDVTIIPDNPGTMNVSISVNYTDDFNQPRIFEVQIPLEVMEMGEPEGNPGMGPGMPGEIPPGGFPPEGVPGENGWESPSGPETFWQKVLRFFKGLLGLGSGQKDEEMLVYGPEGPLPEDGLDMIEVPAMKGP
jgi:hypothetical protein